MPDDQTESLGGPEGDRFDALLRHRARDRWANWRTATRLSASAFAVAVFLLALAGLRHAAVVAVIASILPSFAVAVAVAPRGRFSGTEVPYLKRLKSGVMAGLAVTFPAVLFGLLGLATRTRDWLGW